MQQDSLSSLTWLSVLMISMEELFYFVMYRSTPSPSEPTETSCAMMTDNTQHNTPLNNFLNKFSIFELNSSEVRQKNTTFKAKFRMFERRSSVNSGRSRDVAKTLQCDDDGFAQEGFKWLYAKLCSKCCEAAIEFCCGWFVIFNHQLLLLHFYWLWCCSRRQDSECCN